MYKRFILTGILLLLVLTACNQDNAAKEDKKETITPVETVEAVKGDLVIDKTIYGRTEPVSTTPVMLQNAGEIDALEIANGDIVEEDDHIATIKTPMGKQKIYAKTDGQIANLKLNEGSIAANSEPLAVIIDLDEVVVQLNVTSNMLPTFENEAKYDVAIGDRTYKAEITSINNLPNETGLYPIEATIKNENREILPGVTAVMQIPDKKVKDTIILPTEAIVEESNETFIYVIKDEKAIKTEISIKESQSDKTAIEGDVKAGDIVVINGQLTLTDGSKVEIVKEGNES